MKKLARKHSVLMQRILVQDAITEVFEVFEVFLELGIRVHVGDIKTHARDKEVAGSRSAPYLLKLKHEVTTVKR